MIKLLITDDHPIVRHGLRQILMLCPDISEIDEAEDGATLMQKIIKKEYDVILLDISMPGRSGLSLLTDIKTVYPKAKIIIFSVHPEEQYAISAIKLGAFGYLIKNSSSDEIIRAIRKVADGEKFVSAKMSEAMLDYISKKNNKEQLPHEILSARELEVLCLIGKGKTITEIAKELALSAKSISTYRQRLLTKMKLNSTSEIIRYAIKEGLVG